ncbi:ENTH/ANTH/VHS superfamily protein [Striga asiatica]|uniref:ENTH/ANTH/VHS superfamily protein n=1 Tax=Striga asiatica TaxID=4170 RepID=A0A5A7PXF2_STRAF|nr:ENTH/ANTH/VHS superfamily protein [Striga asiatica]
MAAGSSSQQNFRKAIGAIKDSTSVGLAKVNSEYKDLNVSILKATNHVEVLPKEKHVRIILGAVSGSRPRADVSFCIHALTKRLAKTRTWVVALKTLIVIHRALREVDHSFCEELIFHNKGRGHLLNLLHFKDDSSPSAWDYSAWIRSYALYIEECLECFRVLKYDFYRDHSRTKKLDTPALFEQLPALQNLLFRLLGCEVAAESVRLYVAITDGVLMLVDKMQRRDAVRALEIYRKSGEQANRLSEFFEMCRGLEFGRRQKYVKIEQPPPSFLQSMEEYIKDAPQTLMLPWTSDDDMPKLIAAPSEHTLEADPKEATAEAPSNENTETNKTDKDVPLIPDLLSWDEPSQETSEPGAASTLPLSLATPEGVLDLTLNTELSSESTGWELALVTTPASTSAAQNKVDQSVWKWA